MRHVSYACKKFLLERNVVLAEWRLSWKVKAKVLQNYVEYNLLLFEHIMYSLVKMTIALTLPSLYLVLAKSLPTPGLIFSYFVRMYSY